MIAGFDPERHLCYDGMQPKRTMMKDIGYPVAPGTSNVAFTAAFPLFTMEAVKLLRAEFLQDQVKDTKGPYVRHVPGISSYQVRGYGGLPGYGNFTKAVWTSDKTLEVLSQAGGIELVPVMDYELANVNVQLTHGPETLEKLRSDPLAVSEMPTQDEPEDDMALPIINWHKDSYAWTCIVMLSDTTNMKYGDLVIKTGDGSLLSVPPCPKPGYAMLLQGGYITHLARRALNVPERVTMVPSFRPKNPNARDDSSLKNSHKISNLNRLHYEWTTYRLDLLSERFKLFSDTLKQKHAQSNDAKTGEWPMPIVNTHELEDWANEQIEYLKFTLSQMQLRSSL